jgi:hypothetical protein
VSRHPLLTLLIISISNTLNATDSTEYLNYQPFDIIWQRWWLSSFLWAESHHSSLCCQLKLVTLLFFFILQSIIRGNLQYASMSALRRLPLDPGNPAFLHRVVQGWVFLMHFVKLINRFAVHLVFCTNVTISTVILLYRGALFVVDFLRSS